MIRNFDLLKIMLEILTLMHKSLSYPPGFEENIVNIAELATQAYKVVSAFQ